MLMFEFVSITTETILIFYTLLSTDIFFKGKFILTVTGGILKAKLVYSNATSTYIMSWNRRNGYKRDK